MKKRIVTCALVLAVLTGLAAVLTACRVEGTSNESPAQISYEEAAMEEPAAGVTLNTADHIAYIMGDGRGYFNPDSNMTRAEIAVILHRLLAERAPVTVSYSDVPADAWYAEAAAQLGSLGVLRAGERTFQGDSPITRGEFVHAVASFFPPRTDAAPFADVPDGYPYADDLLSGKAHGWLSGYADGSFHPEQPILRSEAVSILNRALVRNGDTANIAAARPALFLDVPMSAWYYSDVMEATVPHTYVIIGSIGKDAEIWSSFTQTDTGLPRDFQTEGLHMYQGWTYYYSERTRDVLRNTTVGGLTLGADGRFTTGDSWVDEQLREIILSQTNPNMTQEEMLRALFGYCRDHYKYLKWNYYDAGDTSFTLDAARQMLSKGRGNCYCYASVFWYLARWIGYDAEIISGYMYSGAHSWVEIDGYIYDTQLEWRYVRDWGRTRYLWHFYHLVDKKNEIKYRK